MPDANPDLARLAIKLRQGGERVVRRCREAMKRQADKLVVLARSNAPVLHVGGDEMKVYDGTPGNLEQSIKRVDGYDDSQHGRLQIDVVAGGVVNGVDVDKYVLQMEYGLAPYGSGGAGSIYGPGNCPAGTPSLSLQKAMAGNDVGGAFMTRALAARQDQMPSEILSEVSDETEGFFA